MLPENIIKYWKDSADSDFRTMMNLYNSGDYHWSLFIGHLVIEKLLKAIFVKNIGVDNPPKTHDLLLLSSKAGIQTDNTKDDILDLITTFNISSRYPDYQQRFYNKCTEAYTADRITEIEELREWLISILENK